MAANGVSMKRLTGVICFLLGIVLVGAQGGDAPPTSPSGRPPDTVFLEDLTWAEVRDLVKAGTTNVIIGTAGTEQKGPHMVDGEHKFVMEYAADKVARGLGKTLVAPVITYVPEGSWENPGGHMGKPGTITLPQDRFIELLKNAARSLKAGGFKTILFLGESGGNQTGMRLATIQLNELWKDQARAFWIGDYYDKSHADQNKYVAERFGIPEDQIGGHANILDTSELLFVNPKHIRKNKFAPGGGYQNSGVSGDPSQSTPALGKIFIQIKVDNALAQIKGLMSGTIEPAGPPAARGGGNAGRGNAAAGAEPAAPAAPRAAPRPTMETAPEAPATTPPDTLYIDELTWEETRDLMKAGKTTAIIPTGGTEKNGYHMVLGKHNYTVTFAANVMARKLKNALIAPTIQYVPEGNPDNAGPGTISNPSPMYDSLLDAAARSLKAHGFKEILLIGDSGGNQAGLTATATKLNEEWKDAGVKVLALTAYYNEGREHYRAWLLAQYGYDDQMIGSHAGISDTAQLMYVRPQGVRRDMLKPFGGPRDSGVSGDPTKATAEIGKLGIEFKVNAALAQRAALLGTGRGRGRGGY